VGEGRRAGGSLFAEYSADSSDAADQQYGGELTIRVARAVDADALGRISVRREGGSAERSADGFRRLLDRSRVDGSALVLLAEVASEIVGFGKAAYVKVPPDCDAGLGPEGWYLNGVVVDPAHRRRGVGRRLTRARIRWVARRSDSVYYFANSRNLVSIALHERFGFVEIGRGPRIVGTTFEGGEGILFRAEL
jgi:ribosomal protein S18 acetylase RimI-like enzyme